MKPLRLEMQAFGPFARRQVIDFRQLGSKTFFLIHGPTGSGKTSILDGICFALFGDSSGGERDGRQMRSHHADTDTLTEVCFDFALGAQHYRVRRVPEQMRKARRGGGETQQAQIAELCKVEATSVGEQLTPLASRWTTVTAEVSKLLGFESRAGLGRSSVAGLAVGIAVSLLLLWRTRTAARVYRWRHRPGEGVVVWKGAWWQREVWIPMTRLQHLDIKRGPLERWLGLATLELHTAGAHDHETRLPGLEPPRAQALRDALLAELQREGNGGQDGRP